MAEAMAEAMAKAMAKAMASEETVPTTDADGDATTKPYHHGDLRAALIAAGLAILAEEGARALTVRAAARRAGVSHNAPYRHFADKEALLAAIAQQGFERLAVALDVARGGAGTVPRAQLEETGWAYVRFAMAHPDHLRVMFGGLIPDPTRYADLAAAQARAFNVLVEIIQAGQREGTIIVGSSQQLAFAAWAMVHGLSLLAIEHQVPAALTAAYGHEQLVRLCLRQHVDGIGRHD